MVYWIRKIGEQNRFVHFLVSKRPEHEIIHIHWQNALSTVNCFKYILVRNSECGLRVLNRRYLLFVESYVVNHECNRIHLSLCVSCLFGTALTLKQSVILAIQNKEFGDNRITRANHQWICLYVHIRVFDYFVYNAACANSRLQEHSKSNSERYNQLYVQYILQRVIVDFAVHLGSRF